MLRNKRLGFVLVLSLVATMAACGGNHISPSQTLTLSATSVQPGQTITATVANASGPYTWIVSGGTASCGNMPQCTFIATNSGTVSVNANGTQLSASFTVQTGTQVILHFINGLTGAAVAGASVQVIGGPFAVTDGNGSVTLTVYGSSFDFDASLSGYLIFQERYTGATQFVLIPSGSSTGYDETYLKEYVYGDNSRGLGDTTGIHPFQKLQSPSVSWIPSSDISGDSAAMANLVQVGETVSGDLGGLVTVNVGGSGIRATASLDSSLQAVAWTSRFLSGNTITGAEVKFKELWGARNAGTAGHELLRVLEFGAHQGSGLLGSSSNGHMSAIEVEVARVYLQYRDAGFRWPDCSPRRQCQ